MSTHRALVRDQVAEILCKRGIGRVYRARSWPLEAAQLPALLVYGYDEEKTGPEVASAETAFAVACVMAIEAKVALRSRDTEAVEAELETLCRAIELAILTAPGLLGEAGSIERVAGVRTTLAIDTAESEAAIGKALLAFDLRWSELYAVPLPPVDCDEPGLAFQAIPAPASP